VAYIGLDVGTTGCKATIVDRNGQILAYQYKEYNLLFPKSGWVEINAQTVWESVSHVLRGVSYQCNCDLKAISIASFGEALIALDENDHILDNSIFYTDVRGTSEIDDILQKIDKTELAMLTGMPINSMYSINKLLWIIEHKFEVYQKASKLMLFGDFIAYKLTGERKIDYSLASRTMALDITNKVWARKIFDLFSIDMDKFSKPVPSGSIIGSIGKMVAEELNLSKNMMVIAGGHDQACAALGAGVVNIGDAVDGMGTSECISVSVDRSFVGKSLYENNFCCEPHVCPDKYITLAFTTTSGAVIKWYRDTFENTRQADCSSSGKNIYEVLEHECPVQPSNLLMLPHFAGSGTPYMDSYSSGAILGLTLGTTKGEIYKAILEGICFEIMFNADMLSKCGIEVSEITAVGGGAQSEVLLQIKSDIMGKPVKILSTNESGSMGLAILCAAACGDYPNVYEAAKSMVKVKKIFYPRRDFHDQYMEKYAIYKRIYPAMKEIFNAGNDSLNIKIH